MIFSSIKVGNADVLNLENGIDPSLSSPRGRYNQGSPNVNQGSIDQSANIAPYQDNRRAHSEMDLYHNKNDPTELYTTIGPDGKLCKLSLTQTSVFLLLIQKLHDQENKDFSTLIYLLTNLRIFWPYTYLKL